MQREKQQRADQQQNEDQQYAEKPRKAAMENGSRPGRRSCGWRAVELRCDSEPLLADMGDRTGFLVCGSGGNDKARVPSGKQKRTPERDPVFFPVGMGNRRTDEPDSIQVSANRERDDGFSAACGSQRAFFLPGDRSAAERSGQKPCFIGHNNVLQRKKRTNNRTLGYRESAAGTVQASGASGGRSMRCRAVRHCVRRVSKGGTAGAGIVPHGRNGQRGAVGHTD